MPSVAPSPYIIEEYVRWSDVDFAGIIFYGSYVRFFEITETAAIANMEQARPFPIVWSVADMLDGYDRMRALAASPGRSCPRT